MSLDITSDPRSRTWEYWLVLILPPATYGALIPLLDALFSRLARRLNEWENHRTESEYHNHLIAKVFSFRLVNSFCSLYYYAFSGRHPILQLTVQLASFMIVGQTVSQIRETLVPWAKARCRDRCAARRLRSASLRAEGRGGTGSSRSRPLSRRRVAQGRSQAWREARMQHYTTFHDYAEMLVQYGYVTFLSLAFPLAPACALLNNIFGSDRTPSSSAICHRGPCPWRAAWCLVPRAQLISLLAVLTNLAHIGFTSDQFSTYFPSVTSAEKVFLIFMFEHAILVVEWLIAAAVPAAPRWVEQSVRREKFLTHEQAQADMAQRLRRETRADEQEGKQIGRTTEAN